MFSKPELIKQKKLRKIGGKSAFANCYLDDEENLVYSFVKETRFGTDTSREAIARWADQNNPHVPKFKFLGNYEGARGEYGNLFTCPFYYQVTRYSDAYRDAQVLIDIFNHLPNKTRKGEIALDYNTRFLNELYNYDDGMRLSSGVYEALYSMCQAVANCGDEYHLDIKMENFKMDEDGNLILLDMFYPQEIYRKLRTFGG